MKYDFVVEQIEKIVDEETPMLDSLVEDVVSMRFNGQNRNIKMLLGQMVEGYLSHLQLHVNQIHELIHTI